MLLAPNGKQSNLTDSQYKLVRTPAFKKWFGDWENNPSEASKVVDENGEPLVVYHGTKANFYEFEKQQKGWETFWFSPNRATAKMYSQQNNIVGKVFQCFLNVRNTSKKYPFNVNDYDGFIDYKIEMDYFTFKQIKTIQVIQVVNSNQIKLADGSNTTFDSNNKDIRFNKGGQVDELVENVSTEYLNSIRNQDKSRWNYDLEKSIEKQGILEPVTIGYWSEYDKVTLIDGHHRLDTAIDLDIKSIPTIIQLYYNNPTGQHRLYSAPKYNSNAKKTYLTGKNWGKLVEVSIK